MITPVKHVELDCTMYAEAVRGLVEVTTLEDLSGNVSHVGFGGAIKSSYVSPRTGRPVYVLERTGAYAPDAYMSNAWLFESDFTVEQAGEFLEAVDRAK